MNAKSNGAPASLPDFVPVIIVGAGPTGITAATMLGQYGIPTLVLDRHESPYPLPRAVHADDEIYRILARLGVGDEFAAHRRSALGLRLLDKDFNVLAELKRSPEPSANGYPQMNMFDQPELEAMMRTNLKRYPQRGVAGRRPGHQRHPKPARQGAGELPRPCARRRAIRRGRLCPGLRRCRQHSACGNRLPHVRAALPAELVGHRRRHRRRTQPVGRLPPAVQSRACRHVHARRGDPAPVGIPVARRARPPPTIRPSIASSR